MAKLPADSLVLVPKRGGGGIAPGGRLWWVQSFMGSLWLALVFCGMAHCRRGLISVFGGFLFSTGGILILAGVGALF